MNTKAELIRRSQNKCELCSSQNPLSRFVVPPEDKDAAIYICGTCQQQIDGSQALDRHHWHCLTQCMWSEVAAVQVVAWRMLQKLHSEVWAQDCLETLYLDEETLAWAQSGQFDDSDESIKHLDANGVTLETGDAVTLIKDLNVKGTSLTAKRGTVVRKISLVGDNPEQIEGRINGQQIVILTQFVKKN